MTMYSPAIVAEAVVNGLLTGAVYALVALGLTLVYGVLHIINFAHGALLTAAMFAVWVRTAGARARPLSRHPAADAAVLRARLRAPALRDRPGEPRRRQQHPARHARPGDRHRERAAGRLPLRHAHARRPITLSRWSSSARCCSRSRALIGFGAAVVVAVLLWLLLARTDTGKAIRAVAKEKLGASLVGIDVAHVYAVTFGLGCACLAVAACLLMPTFYVNPRVGNAFVLVAFTIVVLGRHGLDPRRAARRAVHRRRREPVRALSRRQPRPDRHLPASSSSCCCSARPACSEPRRDARATSCRSSSSSRCWRCCCRSVTARTRCSTSSSSR